MYSNPFHTKDLSQFSFLITGGAGFIGSNIIDYLIKYNAQKIRVLDNLSTGYTVNISSFIKNNSIEFVNEDISNFDSCLKATKGIDYILHQAALGSVSRSIENPIATNNSNVNGFLNILESAKANNIKRVVYASSSSVYGDNKTLPKFEDKIGNPLSPYAVTKLVDELYSYVFAKTYNMEIIGLRYFNVFGPNQSPKGPYAAVIPLFINAIKNNSSPVIFGDGNQSRDFTFVENAVQANIKALFADIKGISGKVFNVALGENYSVNTLFQTLKDLTGSKINPIYKDKRIGEIENSLADISFAQKSLGYNPEIKLHEGLKRTLDWFISNKLV